MIPTGGVYFWSEMDELEEMIAGLLETARKLRPGAARHEALKEIGPCASDWIPLQPS